MEKSHSLNSTVPALASWAGLGNGPRMLYRLPGFDRLHVLDTGVNRKLANRVPVYLRRVADDGGNVQLDTVTNTERALNMRFKYASRRLRVPHIFPGYFVLESVKQATLTGSEHRRALPFLPFAVAGAVGPAGPSTEHRAVLECVCELVALTNALFPAHCRDGPGLSLSEAVVLAGKAHTWVVDHFQPLLGPCQTTKLHRPSAHLLDEFRLRGNVFDGNSAYNESLHKAVKAAYKATNKRRGQFIEQLIVNEQVHAALQEEEKENQAEAKTGRRRNRHDSKTSEEAMRPTHNKRGRRLRQRYSKKQPVLRMAANRGLPGLADALGCESTALFFPASSMYFGDKSLRHGRQEYTIRASQCFHGSAWLDWLRYRAKDGTMRVGQAALVLTNRAGTRQQLVVRCAADAPADPNCILTQYGCVRLQWDIAPSGSEVALDVVRPGDIVRKLAVEYDWEDLSQRHGVTVMPDEVPATGEELRKTRFFVNAFALPRQDPRSTDPAGTESDESDDWHDDLY